MRTLKEIEDDIDKNVPLGNIGKVMDLVDEHGNTIDKMFYAVIDGDLERIHEMENLGIDITDRSLLKAAIKHNQTLVVYHQVKKGANLVVVIEISRDYENIPIEQWAKFCKRNQMGKK